MLLKNVVAVVTGAASGLGRATAARLVQHGARAVLCDLPTSRGEAVAKELGPNARFAPTDVVNEKDVTAALDLAESAFGETVNVALNFAGIFLPEVTVDENHVAHPVEAFRRTLEVNTFGSFQVARLAAERMSKLAPNDKGERGVIINTASVSAFDGMIGHLSYSASKGAIVGMTLPMARDLGHFGIRVVSIAPGGFSTGMYDQIPKEIQDEFAKTFTFPKRTGDPSEVAHLVQAIIENPFINAETIRIDAGVRARRQSRDSSGCRALRVSFS